MVHWAHLSLPPTNGNSISFQFLQGSLMCPTHTQRLQNVTTVALGHVCLMYVMRPNSSYATFFVCFCSFVFYGITLGSLTHTHTPFNGPLSGTTRVSRYQKGKTNLDFTEARDSEWQWHQLGCMQSLHLALDR